MKKGIIWLMLSWLIVAALVLASCAPAVPGEQEEEEEEEVGPQRGGTFTYWYRPASDPGIPDPHNWGWPNWVFSAPVLEWLIEGDIEKYGPRGTGERAFDGAPDFSGMEWAAGQLVESWEVTPEKVVFHIRPGIYWTGKSLNPGVMERREFTADDVAFNLNRTLVEPGGSRIRAMGYLGSTYVEDKYTAVMEFERFHPQWAMGGFGSLGGMAGQLLPPEMVEAGPRDWKNVVGTGPFYISEYVPGSHMAYAPNLDYWKTTTIDGVEYEIPFIDKLVIPLIEDETTAVAALRTATLDAFFLVRPLDTADLARTTPELLNSPTNRGTNFALFLRTDHPPFDNVEVRRAVMVGTNREAIHEAVIIEGDTYAWPIAPGVSGHVALEDLPVETRLLFDYNPELARQMLADADYPDGFDIEMTIELEPTMMGIAEMVAGMWLEDMGIKVEIKAYEVVAVEEIRAERRFLHSFVGDGFPLLGIGSLDMLYSTGGDRNFSNYSNEYFDEQIGKAFATLDEAERTAILEELFVMTLDAVPTISISLSQHAVHWWPWVKNYYGEISAGGFNPPTDLLWIDQALKAEMGY